MGYKYPITSPHWIDVLDGGGTVTLVEEKPDGTMYVDVTVNGHTYKHVLVENHNRFGAKDRSDVLVEDANEPGSWLYLWFWNSAIGKSNSQDNDSLSMDSFFQFVLSMGQVRAENATGKSYDDSKYDQAESVKRSEYLEYVDVTYKGDVYSGCRETWEPLDGSKLKNTVRILAKDGLYYTLWYWDKDVQ